MVNGDSHRFLRFLGPSPKSPAYAGAGSLAAASLSRVAGC